MPGNKRHLYGRKKKLTAVYEALVVGSIAELREREGSFTSRRLMERAAIRHVFDRTAQTVRRLLNRKGYFFLQARTKGLMSEAAKVKRVEFAGKMRENYPPTVWTGWSLLRLQDEPHGSSASSQRKSMEKKSEGLKQAKGAWLRGVKLEREEKW